MADVNYLDWTSLVLVIVGALNWGLVGLGSFTGSNLNIVNIILGGVAGGQLEALVYVLVGLAGLYQVYFGYELYEEQ
ncbi:MAG: DUF378 domain-containing protein [Candidatus Nanohaloarchaea archaeon]